MDLKAIRSYSSKCNMVRVQGTQQRQNLTWSHSCRFPSICVDVYPSSISDDEITGASSILSLARRNKRWLADKGWQCNGDKFGLIIETPDRFRRQKTVLWNRRCCKSEDISLENPCWTSHQDSVSSKYTKYVARRFQSVMLTFLQRSSKFVPD